MAIWLKKIRGLNKSKLIDSSFVYTEPSSNKIKIKILIQKEILNKTLIQSSFII